MPDWAKIRKDFPAAEKSKYFMSAAMTPCPKPVLDFIVSGYKRFAEAGDIDWHRENEAFRNLRKRIGGMIGATMDDVALVANTSTAMSLLALSIKRDAKAPFNIVSMMDEFPSSTVPFEYQGIEMRYVEPAAARFSVDSILAKTDGRTVAVVTSHVQYATGFRQDIRSLGNELKKRGIMLVVNATQSFPIFPIDVKEMCIDAMSASTHKWGAAGYVGTVFYTSPEFRRKHPTPVAGWLSVDTAGEDFVYMKKNAPLKIHRSAEQYQPGSINWQTIGALDIALKYFEEIGYENIRGRIFELTDYLIAGLEKLPVEIVSPVESKDERSAIVSFRVGDKSSECVKYLSEKNIHTAFRSGSVRVSVNIFNNEEDIDALLKSVKHF